MEIISKTGCTVSPDASSGSESLRKVAMTHAGLSVPSDQYCCLWSGPASAPVSFPGFLTVET